jgi:hypothetical protein
MPSIHHSLLFLFMSATISGIIILKSASFLDRFPSTLCFDGQMWLGAGHILTGTFRYYNTGNNSFLNVGHYFVWIHVLLQHLLTTNITDVKHYQIAKHIAIADSQGDLHQNKTQGDNESHIDDYHVARDIIHIRLSNFPVLHNTHLSLIAHPNKLH